jgi:hypothetical protein
VITIAGIQSVEHLLHGDRPLDRVLVVSVTYGSDEGVGLIEVAVRLLLSIVPHDTRPSSDHTHPPRAPRPATPLFGASGSSNSACPIDYCLRFGPIPGVIDTFTSE